MTLLRQVDPIASERAETANMIAFVDEWASKQPAPPSVEPLPALVPIQRHAGRTVGAPGVLRHSMKSKGRDTLDPVIEMAQSLCDDPDDWAQVWAQMQVLAQEEKPPLLGLIPEGIKYTQVVPKPGIFTGIFTKNALGKRLKRRR